MTTQRQFGFDTRSIHAGQRPDPETGARAQPIYATTSFVFEDAQQAADLFALQTYGMVNNNAIHNVHPAHLAAGPVSGG